MNLAELTILKASKENSSAFFSESHARVLQALIMYNEMYLDEVVELLEIEEEIAEKILSDLVELNLIKREYFQFKVMNPFHALDSLLERRK